MPYLPEHLELLLTDQPYLDVMSDGPWRVPDGLFEEIDERVTRLLSSDAAMRFHGEIGVETFRSPAPTIGFELFQTLGLLVGAGAVVAGPRHDLHRELLGAHVYRPPVKPPDRRPTSWRSHAVHLLPPGTKSLRRTDGDAEQRLTLFALLQQCVEVFAGIAPLERRRHALLELYQQRASDPACRAVDLHAPASDVWATWQREVPAHIVEVIPELGGDQHYAGWVYDRWTAADQHLRGVLAPPWAPSRLLADVMLSIGLDTLPDSFRQRLDEQTKAELADVTASARESDLRQRYREVRAWLADLLHEGAVEQCRIWVDAAQRLAHVLDLLARPAGSGGKPFRTWVPVTGLISDIRAHFTPRPTRASAVTAPTNADEDQASEPPALDPVLGRGPVGTALTNLVAEKRADRLRAAAGVKAGTSPARLVFIGEAGTGKTRAARWLAAALHSVGLLASPDPVIADCEELGVGLVSDKVEKLCWGSRGRLLVLEDVHRLEPADRTGDRQVTLEIIEKLKMIGDDIVVVATGNARDTRPFLARTPKFAAAFDRVVEFPAYTADELATIFERRAHGYGLKLADGVTEAVRSRLAVLGRATATENARLVRNLLERAIGNQGQRLMEASAGPTDEQGTAVPDADALRLITVDDLPEKVQTGTPEGVVDPLAALDRLVGLAGVKAEVRLLVAEAKAQKLRRDADIPYLAPARHMIFTGNPGTAKTTVARLIAQIYADLGLLTSGHLVEVTRVDLVGQYIGQTAGKVKTAVERALGGVLFIDEAYALIPPDSGRDFGHEAVATLVAMMENYRDDLVVITAGYGPEMARFLASNSGLASRFPRELRFPDYTDDELVAIFGTMARDAGFVLAGDVEPELRRRARRWDRGPRFGNARFIRNLLERSIARQAQRVTSSGTEPTSDEVRELRIDDLPPAAPRRSDKEAKIGQYL